MSEIVLGPGALDNPAIPDYVSVDGKAIRKIFGWATSSAIARAIGRKEIPPSIVPNRHQWTVGQLRDWRIRRGILANREAERREAECATLASKGTFLERAALE